MKQLLLSTVATLSLALPAAARDTVVALSPFGPQVERQAQLEQVMHHLLETLDPGETALFIDGYEARRLGAFVVPTKPGYERARAKLAANAEVMGQLKRFLNTKRSGGFVGQLDLPEVLATIAESYPAQGPADLILLGSPVYDDALAPRVSMIDGRVPGDGHLQAKRKHSPYGTAALTGGLQGYDVYFGDTGRDWAVSDVHHWHVERYVGQSVQELGGAFQLFTDDLGTLFARAGREALTPLTLEPLFETEKLEMIRFRPDGAPGRVVSGLINGPVRLRLTWGCESCDLDLYVKLPEGDVISYRNPSSVRGQLYKDQRSSPSLSNGYETVALTGDVDLSKLEVLVNFHTGAAPQGIQGVIEVEAANTEPHQIPLQIDTVSGNRGQDHDAVLRTGDLSPAWARVDLSTLEE